MKKRKNQFILKLFSYLTKISCLLNKMLVRLYKNKICAVIHPTAKADWYFHRKSNKIMQLSSCYKLIDLYGKKYESLGVSYDMIYPTKDNLNERVYFKTRELLGEIYKEINKRTIK